MRAQIVVDGSGVAFYVHDGGQPTHVLPCLQPLVREFATHRGLWDHENLAVHVVYEMTRRHLYYWERFINEQVGRGFTRHSQQDPKYCGLGLERFDGEFHADLDYIYVLYYAPFEGLEIRVPLKRRFAQSPTLENTRLFSRTDRFGNKVKAQVRRRRHKPRAKDEPHRNLEF